MKLLRVILYLLALTSLLAFAQDNKANTEEKTQHEAMQDEEMSEDALEDSEAEESSEESTETEPEDDSEPIEAINEAEEDSDSEIELESEEIESEEDVESTEDTEETEEETEEDSEEGSGTELEAEETGSEDEVESEEAIENEPEDDAESTDEKVHDMGAMEHGMDGMEMQHASVEASQEMNVKLNVYKDLFSGYSIQLIVDGLTFTPENAGQQHVDGEGHAHIYIDGEKIARVYGTSFHLGNTLSEGEHEIKVSLNGNDHSPYTYNGELVEDTVTVEVGLHGTVSADEEMSVELSAYEDTLGGYNIHIQPTGFAFSAANPGALHINGKGYAQIFVNGKMLARSYTPWYNLGGSLFNEGENEIRVKLLGNNHSYYTYRGKAVSATVIVNVASSETDEEAEEDQMSMEGHDMDSMEDMDEAVPEDEAESMDDMEMQDHDMDMEEDSEEEENSEGDVEAEEVEAEESTEAMDDIIEDSEDEVEETESEEDAESTEVIEDTEDSMDDMEEGTEDEAESTESMSDTEEVSEGDSETEGTSNDGVNNESEENVDQKDEP